MWDERDIPGNRQGGAPQRPTGGDAGRNTEDQMQRVTGTSPVVRADGTLFLPPGTLFQEKYAVIEVLGEGETSVVHKARHSVMKNIVAIKLLKGTYESNSRSVLRFQREGQAASRLNHQNIVRVFDFGISREGQPFLAIEYLDGKALSTLLKEHGAPPLPMALSIFLQIADALNAAHAAGFVHRGLKPSNVFVVQLGTPNPQVKLVDFGVADVFDEAEDGSKKVLTSSKFFGNPHYMSPEQCQGKNLDDRTDIYSLGCVMYEGLTGVPAFNGNSTREILHKQINENPRPFREVVPTRTELATIEPVVMKCLAKDPGSRYQTMAQLSRALQEVLDGGKAATTQSAAAAIKDSEVLRYEEQKRITALYVQRGLIAAGALVVLIPIVGFFIFKSGEVEVALPDRWAQAGFAVDRGQYADALKQYEGIVDGARKGTVKIDLVKALNDEAALEHLLSNKTVEANDDHEVAEINQSGADHVFVDTALTESIDALLASDKTAPELEAALKEPVQKTATITQNLAWGQQYAPAQEVMALLTDKLTRKLGASSPLVVNLKLQYASRLLQKIINPVVPLTPSEKKDLVGEPQASLETPLSMGQGSALLLAQANMALAQALSGNSEEAKKQRDLIAPANTRSDPADENRNLTEVRLGDIEMALHNPDAALQKYQGAYQRLVADKKYAPAAYCISAYCRACYGATRLRDGYDFLSAQLTNPQVMAPEAAEVRSEIQARLAQIELSLAGIQDGSPFFRDKNFVRKSDHDLLRDAEKLALESLVTQQSIRPSDLWLSTSAIDTLAKIYFDGSTVGRSVSLLRLKLAVAERTNNARAACQARNNLALALLSYSKAPFAQTYTIYDHSQINLPGSETAQEARALYDQSAKTATAGGETAIIWLDAAFADLAAKYLENDADKVVLLTACGKSCDNVADVYGKDSAEYLDQLRWLGHLAARLGRVADAKKTLLQAKDIAATNIGLPLMDRMGVYNELIAVCQTSNDAASAKKYGDEMKALVRH